MKTMKTKTYYFTKIITFCVLSLFLITNMILFTSCDNGNSPNDNTNEEQNNNAPTDYCKICDGVQDKNHQHDYCDLCEGNQTDSNHECYDYCEYCPDIQTDKNHDCGNYDFFDCCEGIQEESHWCSKMGGEEEIGL